MDWELWAKAAHAANEGIFVEQIAPRIALLAGLVVGS